MLPLTELIEGDLRSVFYAENVQRSRAPQRAGEPVACNFTFIETIQSTLYISATFLTFAQSHSTLSLHFEYPLSFSSAGCLPTNQIA